MAISVGLRGGNLENYKDMVKSKKILQYVNEFWICVNKEDQDQILQILMRSIDRVDKYAEGLILKEDFNG